MLITLIHTVACPACGAEADGVMVRRVRINKRSIRTVKGDTGLGLMPRTCKPCGAELPQPIPVVRTRIVDDDQARINAWRDRRGWPPLPTLPSPDPTT